jgi:adenylate kinase
LAKIIIVTGTPGVGKTVISKLLAKETRSTFLSLSDIVRSRRLHEGFDRRVGSYIINERAVERKLQSYFEDHRAKGIVFETHFVSSIIHKTRGMVAVVLRLDPVLLATRLGARNWPKRKIWENVEAEIIDLSLYDALKVLGKAKVYEIDATGKRPGNIVREVLKALSKKEGWRLNSTSNWLEKYDPILLSKRIL